MSLLFKKIFKFMWHISEIYVVKSTSPLILMLGLFMSLRLLRLRVANLPEHRKYSLISITLNLIYSSSESPPLSFFFFPIHSLNRHRQS